MRIAKEVPLLLPKQRWNGRFWNTSDMLNILCVYYGVSQRIYHSSWQYRVLIAAHRDQHSTNMHRKGYGLDWKSEIKKDLVEYTSRGRIPMDALKFSSARIREAELRVWSDSYIEELKQAVVPETARLMAAE